ncbi:hypothetical protein [Streptomyces sp. TN58]|uniref:hypothetical protein n=1 Tax=Streptomyces sp. TN58 TaxID=234612 RepID=UPI000B22C6F2|nr:hypothetical protein [Streptomyces sp. TN58]
MAIREIRAAAQIIGRRNALRYLAIGVAGSLVAACGGKDGGTAAPAAAGASSAGPASSPPAPAPTSASPIARAFDAFIGGAWKLESTTPGSKPVHGTATVTAPPGGNGGFTILWDADGESVTWTGQWLLRGGHLSYHLFVGGKEMPKLSGGEALTVPGTVEDTVSLTLPWKPPESRRAVSGQQLKVTYKSNVLRIVHDDGHGSESVHVCTRA